VVWSSFWAYSQLPVANPKYCLGKDGRVSFYRLNKKGGDAYEKARVAVWWKINTNKTKGGENGKIR